ncbi:hypothetical protein HXX76_000666 [Chlamydomonas incerta]|uniref:Guanylate cyclase domain-containing protein n=1 Tax=Chlamydomonas incerta TaxID=51695 RepID=A0A836B3A3_CHLIN|nr:hypothetical protein HXX76_000666 [Chlamydomonas incerta]|eukprot:KAG2446064.1 hypothetical protein HXX76_000666 [Chlamydomonas incerta]
MSSLPASGVPAAAAAAGTSHGARPLSTRTGTLHGASRAAGGGAGDAGGGAAGKGADRGPAAAVVMGVIGSSGIGALLRQRFLFTSDDSDTCKQPSCSPATAGQAIPEAVVPARPETRRPPRVSISADEAALQQRLGQAAAAASGGALDLSEPRGPTAGATAGGMRDPALISPWGTRLAATDRAASFSVAASGQAAMVASPGGGRSHGQGATGAAEPAAPLRLLMSGLRVRMGVASGVRLESDITLNRASQRTTYTGRTMAIAKAVSGAAAGGMVLVAAEAHVLLTGADGGAAPGGGTSTTTAGMGTAGILLRTGSSAGSSRNSFSVTSQRALFWAAGTYHLLESYGGGNGGGEERSPPPLDVYLVATPSQVPRWAALPPPAAGKPPTTCVAAGVLAAPVGQLALAVVTVSGAAAIAASSFGVWRQSANLLWREAARLAGAHGGFLATTRSAVVAAAGCDGAHAAASAKAAAGGGHTVLLTAAFPSAVSAMRWSAALLEWGLLAPWPAALLLHDCAEEIWRDDLPAVTAGAGTGAGPTKGGFGGRVCVAADAAPSTPAGAAAASAKTQSALPLTFEPPKQQARGSLSGSAARIAALRMPAGLSTEQQVSSSGLAPRAGAGVVNPALLYTGTVGGTPSQLSRASSLAVAVAVAPSSMLPAPQPALLGEGGADLGGNVLVSESALELPRSLNAALLSAGIRPASGHTALASGSSHSRGGARVRGLCSGAGGGGSTGPGSSNSTGTAGHATPPSRTQAPPGAHAASPSRVQAIDPLLASLPELDGFGAGATGGRNGSDMRQGASDVGTGGFGSRMLPQIPAELPVGGGGSGGGAVAAPALPPSNPAEAVRSNAHASPSASTHLTAATSSSVHCSTHSSSGQAGGSGRTGGGSGGRGSGFSTAVPGRMRRPTVLEVSPSLIPAGLEHHFLGGDVSSGAEGGGVQPQRTVLAVGRPRPAYPPDAGSTASGARASMDDRSSGYRTVVNQMQGFETGVRPGSRRSNLLSQPEGPAPIVLAECPGDAAAREDARDRTGDAGLGDAGAGSATILVEPAERLQGASPLPAAALAPEEEGQSITLVVGVSRGDPLQPLAQWSPSSLDEVTLAPPPVGTATAAVDTGGQPELLAQQPQRAAAWPYASLQTAGGSTGHGGAEAADQAQARAGVFQPVVLRTAAQAMCATTTQTVVSTLPSTAEVERPELHAEAAAAGAAAAQPQFPQHHSQQAGAPGANSSAAAGPRAGTPAAAADGPGGFPGRGVGVPLLPPPRPLRTSAVGSVRTRSSAHGGSSQLGFTSDGDGGVMLAEDFLPFFLCRGLRLRCGVDYGVATADVNCITGMVQYRGPVAVAAAALAARAPVSQVLVSSAAAATASAAIAAEAAVLAEDSISKARMLASPESVYLASRPPTVAQPAGSPGEITPQQ